MIWKNDRKCMRNLVKTVQKIEQKMAGEVPETGINKGKTGVSQESENFILTARKWNKNKAYRKFRRNEYAASLNLIGG